MEEKLRLWMWLTEVFGTANPRKWDAYPRYKNIEDYCDALKYGDVYDLTYDEKIKVKHTTFENVDKTIEYCEKNNINIYCCESEGFPDRLKNIYNPPSVIYARHSTKSLDFLDDNVTIAVVGARKIDDYYAKVTTEISGQLAKAGIIVASGFAVGADSMAHSAAIEAKGKTVAVLGSGIDYDYPKGTMKFKEKVAENGAVISEFLPKHNPMPNDFKARNRVLSGISMGVLVTQASMISGALNTVANAVSQGRDIFCVPPRDVFDEKYSGVVGLIRDGAIPVFDGRDVIYEYCENYSHKISYAKAVENYTLKSEDTAVFSQKPVKKQPAKAPKKQKPEPEEKTEIKTEAVHQEKEINLEKLSENQRKIVSVMKGKQLLADEISRAAGIDVMELLGELTELEIDGIVKSLPGNRYSL